MSTKPTTCDGVRRQEKFKSAFRRLAFNHGVALKEEEVPVFNSWMFKLRVGTMQTLGKLSDVLIREVICAVPVHRIEHASLEPHELAEMEFTEAFTKLSALR